MLKEEILDWIKSQPKEQNFTSAEVYESVHSAEDPRKVSDVLRGLAKSNILDRHEFYEGNKKRFTYWLKEEPKAMSEPENALSRMGGFSPAPTPADIIKKSLIFDDSDKVKSPRILTDMVAATKQIEIPNNFTLELKTPNGFVITIRSSDINAK